MTTTTPSFSSDETLAAMLRQEAIYFTNSNSNNNSKASSMKQAVAALESIYELLSLQDRETLVIATSYLYRYYSNFNGQPSSISISVSHIALICFYMAVKIHQTTALPIKSLSDLHCRFFPDASLPSSSSWEWIELDVCTRLKWRLHPPMPMAFVDCHGNNSSRRQRKRAQSLLDQAFRSQPLQYVSGRHRPSSLAAAALFLTSRRGSLSPSSSSATTPTLTKEEEAAVAFLQEATATATTTVMATTKQPRKRCVTPPPPPTSCMMLSHPPAKKQRCGLMMGPASLRWTGSPRSAALMVEEEESF